MACHYRQLQIILSECLEQSLVFVADCQNERRSGNSGGDSSKKQDARKCCKTQMQQCCTMSQPNACHYRQLRMS